MKISVLEYVKKISDSFVKEFPESSCKYYVDYIAKMHMLYIEPIELINENIVQDFLSKIELDFIENYPNEFLCIGLEEEPTDRELVHFSSPPPQENENKIYSTKQIFNTKLFISAIEIHNSLLNVEILKEFVTSPSFTSIKVYENKLEPSVVSELYSEYFTNELFSKSIRLVKEENEPIFISDESHLAA